MNMSKTGGFVHRLITAEYLRLRPTETCPYIKRVPINGNKRQKIIMTLQDNWVGITLLTIL